MEFNSLIEFFSKHGLWMCLIAVGGIILLGVLKYCNVFKKLDEKYRHYLYIGCALVFSLAGSAIYLACTHAFEINYFFTVAAAIYALDQAFYNLFKVTSLNDLCAMILDFVKKLFTKSSKEDKSEK